MSDDALVEAMARAIPPSPGVRGMTLALARYGFFGWCLLPGAMVEMSRIVFGG